MSDSDSLYARVGGETALEQIVDAFYNRILADPELKPFFAHTPSSRIRLMQRQFLAAALGGPKPYPGRSIREVHRGRGITRRHLQLFIQHLTAALEQFGLSEEDKRTIAARIQFYTDDVVQDHADENF